MEDTKALREVGTAKMKLRTGLWLTGDLKRLSVTRNPFGNDPKGVIGHILRGSNDKWKIEGTNDEFDSATLAANELLKACESRGRTGYPSSVTLTIEGASGLGCDLAIPLQSKN
jgi:hypothetical protein